MDSQVDFEVDYEVDFDYCKRSPDAAGIEYEQVYRYHEQLIL